jgi:uncharacterized membrane protein
MAFCSNCGSEVQGKFCAKCGAPAGAPAPQQGPPGYTPPPPGAPGTQYAPPPAQAGAGLEENVAAALCYLLGVLTGVLFLVLEPYNKNKTVRFHAFQSIFVWLGTVVLWIAFAIVASILSSIIGFGASLIFLLYWFGMFALWVALMYKAYNKERWVLPIIGPLAEKQA